MDLNEFAVGALENAKWLATAAVEDLTDAEMMFQPKEGLNHATWLLGHIAGSENGLILSFCKGENLLPKGWHGTFGIGSKPTASPAAYPTKDEILAHIEKVHAAAVTYVKSLSAENLDKRPPGIDDLPERVQEMFSTIGKCIFHHVTHASGHAGQISMLRRLMGKAPRV